MQVGCEIAISLRVAATWTRLEKQLALRRHGQSELVCVTLNILDSDTWCKVNGTILFETTQPPDFDRPININRKLGCSQTNLSGSNCDFDSRHLLERVTPNRTFLSYSISTPFSLLVSTRSPRIHHQGSLTQRGPRASPITENRRVPHKTLTCMLFYTVICTWCPEHRNNNYRYRIINNFFPTIYFCLWNS